MSKIYNRLQDRGIAKTSGILLLVLVAALGRLIPHPWNMTPLLASGLCGVAYLGRWGLVIPLAAMLISDLVIGFYSLPMMLAVYGSLLLATPLAFLLRDRASKVGLVAASVVGSTLFFLITNAAVWLFGTMYPHTLSGLLAAYAMGIPFFKNALAGDVLFTVLIAGVIELILCLVGFARVRTRALVRP